MPAFLAPPPPHCGIREEEEEDACPASLAIIRRRGTDQASSHPGWESLRDTKECTITASKRVREERRGVEGEQCKVGEGDFFYFFLKTWNAEEI